MDNLDDVLEAGYGSMRAFYDGAGSQMGVTPAAFSNGSPDARVQYTVLSSPLGEVLVAATGRGVCAVRIGDAGDELVAELAAEFPRARVERDDDALEHAARIVSDLACGRPAAAADLPARSPGLHVSGCGVAGAEDDPHGNDRHLWRAGGQHREADISPGGGGCLRRQPRGSRGSVPSRRAGRWLDRWVSLGRGAQASTAGRRVDGWPPELLNSVWSAQSRSPRQESNLRPAVYKTQEAGAGECRPVPESAVDVGFRDPAVSASICG